MPTLSTYTNGAVYAVNASAKARRTMTNSLGRLSTGIRTLNGNDPAGQSVAGNITTQARSANVAFLLSPDVTTVISIPLILSTLSKFISGKIICSFIPKV